MEKQRNDVQNYYGKVLEGKKDLKTTACCPAESLPEYIKPLASKVAPEIIEKFYGCGIPLPSALEGKTVLDLGCGTGRDVYILSQLVGENGHVIGVDMTDEQLATARKHLPEQMQKFGFKKPNVTFLQGYIEDLKACDIADASVDLVISNCVFNLSPNKPKLFEEVFRVLKPGGELFFSDVFSDRRLPAEFQEDEVLLGECLGGAIYIEDLRRYLGKVGCQDFRTVSASPLEVTDPEVKDKLGLTLFESRTVRAFKLDLEDRCEDYGQIATYLGTLDQHKHGFQLDDHHLFVTGKPMAVCSNTALMLQGTRFKDHFKVDGDTSTHYGLFDCGPANFGAPSLKINDQGVGCC